MIIGVATGLGTGSFALVLISSFCEAPRSQEREAASDTRVLRMAAQAWRVDERSNECPSVAQLKRESILDPAQPDLDPWGNAYRIECKKGGVAVSSSGPDSIWRTGDDIATPWGVASP